VMVVFLAEDGSIRTFHRPGLDADAVLRAALRFPQGEDEAPSSAESPIDHGRFAAAAVDCPDGEPVRTTRRRWRRPGGKRLR
jgi:hypothetical protein